MALPSSGAISLNNVNVELGNSGTANINMGSAAVRDLFGVASGAIDMADGYGKANISMSNSTGGTITTSGGYRIHTFTSSGTFTAGDSGTVEYIVVAGGGGGSNYGGGSGGGGYRSSVSGESSGGGASSESTKSVTASAYTVTVGAGGTGSAGTGTAGGNSVFSTITSLGGGWGSQGSGGSGGGGWANAVGGAGTAGQGYAGGTGDDTPISWYCGGGGGGAGAVGGNASPAQQYNIGDGGIGVQSSITGTATYYAGGGGGGNWGRYSTGYSSTASDTSASPQTPIAFGTNFPHAPSNRGGGAGGVNGSSDASIVVGNGGSGVVIIRYAV